MRTPYGHCTNCHADFEPTETALEMCAPCARAYAIGFRRGGGEEARDSFVKGFERGKVAGLRDCSEEMMEYGAFRENERIRDTIWNRSVLGFESYDAVVAALWPDDGEKAAY